MEFKAILVNRVSSKGNAYEAIEVSVTDTIKKLVFLSPAELELLHLKNKDTEEKPDTDFWK